MIELSFRRTNGLAAKTDLTKLKKIAVGISQIHQGWESTLTYSDEYQCYIELSEGTPNLRGNSEGAANEVTDEYAKSVYQLESGSKGPGLMALP
jgi:hypothetical protein